MEINYYKSIIAEIKYGIGFIYLNRPEKLNAINIQMRLDILNCLSLWETNEKVEGVMFSGSGDSAFSGGFDLDEFKQVQKHDEILKSSTEYHHKVWNFSKPTIAVINGYCMGGGMDLATLCDIRICSENSTFGHPEIQFGAPPLITPLRWIIGEGRAREWILTGRKVNATEALSTGFVSQKMELNYLMECGIDTAKTVCKIPNSTFRFMKSYMNSRNDFITSFEIEHDKAFQEIILPMFKKNV